MANFICGSNSIKKWASHIDIWKDWFDHASHVTNTLGINVYTRWSVWPKWCGHMDRAQNYEDGANQMKVVLSPGFKILAVL